MSVIETDASEYRIQPDENVFFFFNPFGDQVLDRVICNINDSMREHPRRVIIIYGYPVHHQAIESHQNYRILDRLCFGGHRFIVYEGRPMLLEAEAA